MHCEDGGHQRAGPQAARHAPENQEQEDRRNGVQQDVDDMVHRGGMAEEVPHEHVREARQRGPAFQMPPGKHRQEVFGGQFSRHQRVVIDALVVVVIDEVEAGRLTKYQPDGQQQETANDQEGNALRGPQTAARQARASAPVAACST